MKFNPSSYLVPHRPTRLAIPLAFGLLLLIQGSIQAGGDEWVEYLDQSASRISADAGLGISDPEEKDIISGDVDQDGDSDLIIVRKVPFSVMGPRPNVLFMNEGGVMTDRTSTLAPDFLDATDDRDVILADVDGDTWLDIVTTGTFEEQPRILMNLGNTTEGAWQGFVYDETRLPVISPGPHFCAVGFGDVTGNDRPDLYFTDYDNTTEDRLLINDGFGFFTDETATRLLPGMADSTFGTDAHIVDVNGDTFNDIIKNNASGNNPPPGFDPHTAVLYNDGTGHFDFLDEIYNISPYMVEPADFTLDGRLDLFIVDDGQDRYLINTGNDKDNHAEFSTTSVSNSPMTAFFGGNVKFADLDGDNNLDVLVADVDTDISGCSRRMVLLQGQGTAPNISYTDPLGGASRPWTPSGVFDIEAMHIDNDGILDLWVATCTGNLVFMGVRSGIFGDDFENGNAQAWSNVVGEPTKPQILATASAVE